MNKNQATIAVTLIASITVIIVLLIYIIHAKLQATTSSSSTSSTSGTTTSGTSTSSTSTWTWTWTWTGTSTSTTCNITCPPGYEVDPLTCECSPLVPANIVVQPNPFFNIRLWLVLGSTGPGTACIGGVPRTEWISKCVPMGKACLGFHPEWSSCCPSPPNTPCQYCDPRYGCNPNVAQTSGTVSFTGQVLSSNGTPIPNTKVNVKSPFPMTYNLTVYPGAGSATVTVTLYPPPSTVTTDETGTFTVTVPIKAVLTSVTAGAYLGSGQGCNTFSLELPAFQFYLSIPDSAIVVPAVVNYNITLCVNQENAPLSPLG